MLLGVLLLRLLGVLLLRLLGVLLLWLPGQRLLWLLGKCEPLEGQPLKPWVGSFCKMHSLSGFANMNCSRTNSQFQPNNPTQLNPLEAVLCFPRGQRWVGGSICVELFWWGALRYRFVRCVGEGEG